MVRIGILLAALTALPSIAAADGIMAVTTPGSGTLTMCRNWLLYDSCTAHKVALPTRVAVGDNLRLSYGSNPKDYTFHIGDLRLQANGCTILSDQNGSAKSGERIDVAGCHATSDPAANR